MSNNIDHDQTAPLEKQSNPGQLCSPRQVCLKKKTCTIAVIEFPCSILQL